MTQIISDLVCLIPARAGSKRLPNKNAITFFGHPLIAYTIQVAQDCGIFREIYVSTDSSEYARIAQHYGAQTLARPEKFAADTSPDIEWVSHSLEMLKKKNKFFSFFSILRPTNPFRSPSMIKKAWQILKDDKKAHSIRAVETCQQHPAKMWVKKGKYMKPLYKNPNKREVEWHSTPYQTLPPVYAQNASLEIAKTEIVFNNKTISGKYVLHFETRNFEGFDINSPEDLLYATTLVSNGIVKLPNIRAGQYK